MKRIFTFLSVAAVFLGLGASQGTAAPPDAVVRISSHGASATVIHTEKGRSLLLGCAHAYQGKDRTKQMALDIPTPDKPTAPKQNAITLLAVDYELDLSLVELKDGPLPYVCPVAPKNHRPSRNILSVGYDEMKWPSTQKAATILGSTATHTFTRERPWHGRSGGALIDLENSYVIGVVQGYETSGERRGMYVSLEAIHKFLTKAQGTQKSSPKACPDGTCPNGQCPNGCPNPDCPNGKCPPARPLVIPAPGGMLPQQCPR
jgi:hypothetical protein